MSNTERQRRFRERNPGYYGRLHRKRQAAIKASLAMRAAIRQRYAEVTTQLLLPAPAERIPGVNAIPTREELHAMRQREAILIDRAAA